MGLYLKSWVAAMTCVNGGKKIGDGDKGNARGSEGRAVA